jgi:hypothetical protein
MRKELILGAFSSSFVLAHAQNLLPPFFSNYPPALDPTDTKYTVAELTSNNTETPYPNAGINSPPGGSINYTTTPPTGAIYQNYLIGVQPVDIDPTDRLWILDTGRAATPNSTIVHTRHDILMTTAAIATRN